MLEQDETMIDCPSCKMMILEGYKEAIQPKTAIKKNDPRKRAIAERMQNHRGMNALRPVPNPKKNNDLGGLLKTAQGAGSFGNVLNKEEEKVNNMAG